MVGTGELKSAVVKKIKELDLAEYVQVIDCIPNSDIWELYRIADSFINLNQQEIFGMAILEAMYYGCKVVAWKAPGPNLIIENNVSGYLVESNEEVIKEIGNKDVPAEKAHERVVNNFTWKNTAEKIKNVLKGAMA